MRIASHIGSAMLVTALFIFGFASASGAQTTMSPAPSAGAPLPHLTITTQALAGLRRRTVSVSEDGQTIPYSGVDLGALLAKNGAPQGVAFRGAAAADFVVVRAADGYRAVFALGELDAALTDKIVLLAYERNGSVLGADLGPFRIIVPDEKHHVRWVRNVIDVQVMVAP